MTNGKISGSDEQWTNGKATPKKVFAPVFSHLVLERVKIKDFLNSLCGGQVRKLVFMMGSSAKTSSNAVYIYP